MSNSLTGINLTTLAAGVVAPIQTNAALGSLPGGSLPSTAFYSQISVCTTTNNAIALPNNPQVGQVYTIRNDGVAVAQIFPGSSTSTINGVAATAPYPVGAGTDVSFVAISNNQALNTAATSAAPNNPLVAWQVNSPVTQANNVFTVLTAMTTASANSANTATNFNLVSGTTYIVPAMAGTCAVTLPANASSAGVNYKFIMSGTVGNAMTLTSATATKIKGTYTLSGGIVIKAAATTGVITATALTGDSLSVIGDGDSWYVTGLGSAAASFS